MTTAEARGQRESSRSIGSVVRFVAQIVLSHGRLARFRRLFERI